MTKQEAIIDIIENIKPVVGGKSLEMAVEALESQILNNYWIPCSKSLPDKLLAEAEKLLYWTTHEDGSIILHGYTKRNGFIYNWEVDDLDKRAKQGQVVAWMPIYEPQPYVEKSVVDEQYNM